MKRSEQQEGNTWDLSLIFKDEAEFSRAIGEAESLAAEIKSYEGGLREPDGILAALRKNDLLGILCEKIGSYAYMRLSADGSDPENQRLYSVYVNAVSKLDEMLSFFTPELMELSEKRLMEIAQMPAFADYKVLLARLVRQKKYILSKKEERLLSLQSPVSGMFSQGFDDLTDVDFKFGKVNGSELTNSTFSVFLHDKDISVRKKAYFKYYRKFDESKHLIARLYEGSIRQHVFMAKAKGYESVLGGKLYADNIPQSVYLNLIDAAHNGFGLLKRYYELKRRTLGLEKLSHYDVYVSLSKNFSRKTSYEEAARLVREAVAPLGAEYQNVIYEGITDGRWVDRYENAGKASGAYSNGSYDTLPYIMMNYKDDSYRDIFTLAHEGGHSMHSYYSARNNPFSCYNYSIFEAEIASTFNERLLARYLYSRSADEEEKIYLLSQEADDIVATFFRQTMFAEFEYKMYGIAERDEPVTLDVMTSVYGKLLRQYFGKDVRLFKKSALEGLRIPHFYRPFYVYKYATGITAAIILSTKVLAGGEEEREGYLRFLKSGGSLFPLENLKRAGADLAEKSAFDVVLKRFETVLSQLEEMLYAKKIGE